MTNYKSAGVDIDVGNAFVEAIKPVVRSTEKDGVIGSIGSFSGAFRLPAGYKKPILLAATDGVGTKLRFAIETGRLGTIGIDLVAMCVNDLICNRGDPLFFLDYYATGKLRIDNAKAVIEGIALGCLEAGCTLIGGETAEMPNMYHFENFDLAGFAVGIAEEDDLLIASTVKAGDVLIALPSSGLHSNGYSLARKLLLEQLKMRCGDEFDGQMLIDILLTPTEIYVKRFKAHKNRVKALAHITGGGIVENLPRSMPNNTQAVIDKNAIKIPEIFKLMSKYIDEKEMFRAFNMGVGMIWIADKNDAARLADDVGGYIIGEVIGGERKVVLK
jgi:phosphoribosylformylglycinamidine cyclo-ligase